MSSLSVPAAPDCTIVFDSEGGYCLEDTLSRRPDPLTLADALTCIATDECEVPERFADLLEANQNARAPGSRWSTPRASSPARSEAPAPPLGRPPRATTTERGAPVANPARHEA